ncbi:hypothetical protein ABI59_02695 [Acidobacteria bacterium Mor1]|nr:hypothetical protein ABI59_02695 [Acidobacteria bacterium Mor1]
MANQYLPLGCFGKVPCWREHVERGVSQRSSRGFREWLRQGRALATEGDEQSDFLESRGQRFLIAPPGSPEVCAGVIAGSHDQANRPYPLVVLTHIPRRLYGRHFALLPFGLGPVWEALEDEWQALHGAASHADLEGRLDEAEIPAPLPPGDLRGPYQGALQDSMSRIFERSDGATLGGLLVDLPEALGGIKRHNGSGVTLVLPASEEPEDSGFEASFWVEWINRQFLLRRYEPSIFIDAESGAGDARIRLVYGELDESHYAAVLSGAPEAAGVLRTGHGEGAGGETAAGSFSDFLKRKV